MNSSDEDYGPPETRDDPALAVTGAQSTVGELETVSLPGSAPRLPGRRDSSVPTMAPPPPREEGLEQIVLLASGGMGEVHRAHDRSLNRLLAMKVLHERLSDQKLMRMRFQEEAQVTAQLAHPSIPPVHEVGELPDGRPYFTMKEVHGRTLTDIIDEVAAGDDHPWSERRRLEVFQKICEAVAYAHSRGVVHCDLKPPNVMVGAFGEVLVMDWGVARITEPAKSSAGVEPPVRVTSQASSQMVAGTPAYMPPEQAIGEAIGPSADVFALGVMLYELLSGKRPYDGGARELIFLSARGEFEDIPASPGSVVDGALMEIIRRAMQPEAVDRYPDAAPMADELARWREGAKRREEALSLVAEAAALLPDVEPMREEARQLHEAAEEILTSGAVGEDKSSAWLLQDQAEEFERDASLIRVEATRLLRAALHTSPGLPEARALLARIHYEEHREAERRRAWGEAARHELLLREQNDGEYDDYLAGNARIRIETSRPCHFKIRRYRLQDRRLLPSGEGGFEAGMKVDEELSAGSYRLEITPEDDGPSIYYPVVLRRRQDWVAQPPGADALEPIALPREGELEDDEVLVPAGWFDSGGDQLAAGGSRAHRVWLDTFVVRRHPVTFGEIVDFLADSAGAPFREEIYRDGVAIWDPRLPCVGLSWDGASAYARWLAERAGRAWALPSELQWEKAARGVDGRCFPWGDFGDDSFCHVRGHVSTPTGPACVGDHPVDVSPFGVHGLAGNVREWCASDEKEGVRPVRGGSWRLLVDAAQVAARSELPEDRGFTDVGFRLVRPL